MKETPQSLESFKNRLEDSEKDRLCFLRKLFQSVTGQIAQQDWKTIRIVEEIKYYFDHIISVLPEHIYWQDKTGKLLGCNEQQAKDLGLSSREDVVGKTIFDLLPLMNAKIQENINQEVISSGKSQIVEEIVSQNGRSTVYLSHKKPLTDKLGNIIGLLGISVDITERKKTEEELRKAKEKAEVANSVKSQFIQNMQHDMRTPASGIYYMFDMMAMEEKDPEKLKLLEIGRNSAMQLLNICDDVLEFGNIDSNSSAVLEKKFDIRKEVDAIFMLEHPAAITKKLNLNFHVDDDVPQVVKGDDQKLRRILMNLIGNAIKFTKEGEVDITVKYLETRDETILLQFIVRDTGMGIPEDKIDTIYEQFVRGTPSNQNFYKGVGLGLRIVKKFVDELGGEINVKSKVGDGTTFKVTLPFVQPLTQEADEVRM